MRLLTPSTLAKNQEHEDVDEQHGTTNSCASHAPDRMNEGIGSAKDLVE
ncbi:hypothetical protein [Streptomyces sp. 6N223]